MQPRRILYVIAITVIAFFVFNYHEDQMQETAIPAIDREQIFDDFKNQTDEVWLSFPENFRGNSGELFYFGQQVSEKPVTKVYRVYSRESGELDYRVHDEWDNVKLPANRFETFYLVQGEWNKDRK